MIKLTELLKGCLSEASIKPGTKEYFNKNLSDDEILSLAKQLGEYPHSNIKKSPERQIYFRDLGNLLGYPTNPTDIVVYDDGTAYVDKAKMKMNPKKAVLFQMYKAGKLDMKEYGEIQKSLYSRYVKMAKLFLNGLMYSRG